MTEICPRGCATRCHATNAQPCDNPRYQDPTGSVTSMLQQFLINRNRANPIDRNESAAVTSLTWERIKAAYAGQFARANAWDDVSQSNETLGHPPIVHAAGAIPPEVEQAVTEQIERRTVANALAANWTTEQEDAEFKEAVKAFASFGSPAPTEPIHVEGITIGPRMAIVSRGPTPEPGWLKRLLRGLFG